VITDDFFRSELDLILKRRKMLKAERSVRISELLLLDGAGRDAALDYEEGITNKYLAEQTEAKIIPTEHCEQAAFIHWFRHTYPGVLIFAIPNGGNRSAREAQTLVLEGVTAGVADLFIDDWNCYVEFKRIKGGVWSEEQQKFAQLVQENGKTYLLVKGLEDAKEKILLFINK